MSVDRIPDNITFKVDRPSLFDFLLKSAHSPTFPFLSINIKSNENVQDYSVEVNVGSKMYDYIKSLYFQDQLLLYMSLPEREIGFWSSDMLRGIRILTVLDIIDNFETWVKNARIAVTSILSQGRVESRSFKPLAFTRSEQVLKSFDILGEVKENQLLPVIVRDVIERRNMDSNTIIYRLAMSLYHLRNATGKTFMPVIDDPSNAYIKLLQTDFYKEFKDAFTTMVELPVELRNMVLKVIIVFTISAYVYYKEVQSHSE